VQHVAHGVLERRVIAPSPKGAAVVDEGDAPAGTRKRTLCRSGPVASARVVRPREPRQRERAEQQSEVAQRDVVEPGMVSRLTMIPASQGTITGAP
jgi:hypothetical protein